MDSETLRTFAHLIRSQRTASFGTLRDGSPLVSLVLFAPASDFTSFFIHVSRLAHHTQDILLDPRVGLMISTADPGEGDPQTLPRVSIRGAVEEIPHEASDYETSQATYLAKHPQSGFNFQLGDFSLFRIRVHSARFVAGFGKIYNLSPQDFRRAASVDLLLE